MICINNNTYLAEFKRSIESNNSKAELLSILESRLNGSLELTNLNDNVMLSFDFRKTLSDKQKYYLDQFDEHYYPKQLIQNTEYLHKILEPVILQIKNSYDNMIQFMSKKPDSIKQIYIYHSKYSEHSYSLNILLEFCLILPKMNALNNIIVQHFHTILGTDFHINKLVDTSKKFDFRSLYEKVYDHIVDIYFAKSDILCKVSTPDESQKEEMKVCAIMVPKIRKILNGLFWIVYANEFKFLDNTQQKHLIREEDHEKYQEKVSKWFKYEDEVVTETGEIHRLERDILSEAFDFMEKVEAESYTILEKKVKELDPDLNHAEMDKYLEEELDKYIDTLTNDEEEKRMYKVSLRLNISYVLMDDMIQQMTEHIGHVNRVRACK
jgi:hypothetical protein